MAAELGVKVSKIYEILEANSDIVYLNAQVGDDGSAEHGDFIEDSRSYGDYRNVLDSVVIEQVLNRLSEKHRMILEMRFGINGHIPHSLSEVAAIFGVSKSSIGQIESRALKIAALTQGMQKNIVDLFRD